MGSMKLVSICTDCMGDIVENPVDFAEGICSEGHGRYNRQSSIRDMGIGGYANFIQVMRSHHAGIPVLVMQWQNVMTDLSSVENMRRDESGFRYYNSRIQRAKEMLKETEREFIDAVISFAFDTLLRNGTVNMDVCKSKVDDAVAKMSEIECLDFDKTTLNHIKNRVWKDIQAWRFNQEVK